MECASEVTSYMPCTGEAAACMSASDRRHGDGQRHANATFRQFVLDMICKHGDDAKKGIKHFESDAVCLTSTCAYI